MRFELECFRRLWPRFIAANDVPCSQSLTAEHHSSLAGACTSNPNPASGLQRPLAKFHWGSRDDEEPTLGSKHGVPELPLIEAGP